MILVVRDIASHFPARYTEWLMAVGLTLWGARLVMTPDAFDRGANFGNMAYIATPTTWGLAALFVGFLRIGALTINGSFHSYPYSPHLRASTAALGCLVWSSVALALLGSPTGGIAYPLLMAFEAANVWRAASDAGAQRAAHARSTRT